MPEPRREGMVLLVAVLVLLGLGMVATGLLYVGLQELRISRADEAVLRARLAAESGIRTALVEWDTRDYRGMAAAEVRKVDASSPGYRSRLAVEKLAGPLYRVRVEATLVPAGARARAGAVVRALDIAELWREFGATVTLGGALDVDAGAVVDGLDRNAFAAGWTPADCPAAAVTDLVRTFGGADVPARHVPDSTAVPAEPRAGAGIGPLGPATLAAIADHTAERGLRPTPAHMAEDCDVDDPANWGAPLAAEDPCGQYFPLVFAPGDLRIAGGTGQGVLVVAGNLTLEDGARFHGAIVVAGHMTVREGSTVRGAATVGGDVAVADDARITYDPCAIWSALAHAPALNRAFRTRGRFWVPVF